MKVGTLLTLVATVAFAGTPAAAQEQPAQGVAQEPNPADAGAREQGEHKNTLSVFLGGTLETAEDETYFTIGLEYERELGRRWALLTVAEHVSDFDAWVFVAPIAFKPFRGLSLMAGPGFETTPRRPEGHEEAHGTESGEDGPFFLLRFGVGYTHLAYQLVEQQGKAREAAKAAAAGR